MSGGELNHCIIGVAGERCDYFVYGMCLDQLGEALDLAKPEIQKRENFKEQIRRQTLNAISGVPGSVPVAGLAAVHEYETFGGQPDSLIMPIQHQLYASDSNDNGDMIEIWSSEAVEFICLFMNQSLVHKLQQAIGAMQTTTAAISKGLERRRSIMARNPADGTMGDSTSNDDAPADRTKIQRSMSISRQRSPSYVQASNASTLFGSNRKSISPSQATDGQMSRSGMSLDVSSAMEVPDPPMGNNGPRNRRISNASDLSMMQASNDAPRAVEGGRSILSEYRKVSVMFVKLAFKFDPDLAQRAYTLAFNAMLPYDGVIQQYSVDDKGQSLLIVFGLPPWGHENNALYALKASMSLSSAMKKDNVSPFTISIATGDLLFSMLGNVLRSEAGLLGDVVNISARLMSLPCTTELSILCDHETKMSTTEIFNYLEFGHQIVKGKTESIQVWAALSSKGAKLVTDSARQYSKSEKPIFGYLEETKTFTEATEKWKEKGGHGVIIIEAASGMGKSTLLEQLVKENEKILLATFHCYQGVMRNIYSIFVQELLPNMNDNTLGRDTLRTKAMRSPSTASSGLMESILANGWNNRRKKISPGRDSISVDGDYGGSVEAMKFLSYFGENPDLAPILHDVMPWIKIEENTVTSNLGGQARTTLLHEMIVKIISTMTDSFDLAIAFDNAQFIDNTSMDITLALLKVCPKLLLIVATRPIGQYKIKGIDYIMKNHKPTLLRLHGISLKDTEDFLNFNLKHVVSVMETDLTVEEVAEAIKEYDSFQFLKKTSDEKVDESDKGCEYYFRHVNFNNAIYESLPFSQRQDIHFKIASYLESILTDENRATTLPNLTFHYMRTAIRDKNYFFMEQLALYYYQHKLFQEASVALERLIKFYESDSQASQDPSLTVSRQSSWLSLLGACLSHIERRGAEARMVTLRALTLAGIPWPKAKEGIQQQMQRQILRLFFNVARTFGGSVRLGKGMKTRDERLRLEVIFRSLAILRNIASLNPATVAEDVPLGTLLYINYALENSAEYLPELFKSAVRASQLFWFADRKRMSRAFLRLALRVLPRVEVTINLDLIPAAHALCYSGCFSLAKEFLTKCSKAAEMTGDRSVHSMAEFFYIEILMLEGNARECIESSQRVLQVCDVSNDTRTKSFVANLLAFMYIFTGNPDSDELVKSQAGWVLNIDPITTKMTGLALALHHFKAGRLKEAGEIFSDACLSFDKILLNQVSAVIVMCIGSFFPFLFITELNLMMDTELITKLVKGLEVAKTGMQRCARFYVAAEFVLPLLICGKSMMANNGKEQALLALERARAKPSYKKHQANLAFLDNLIVAVLGRFLPSPAKDKYHQQAVEFWARNGCFPLVGWIKGASFVAA
ncbi:hypothetical protein HDU96_003718 [Phlyctochytrium bullatum]|nr:hypothetical protein HDU96_003718 [Phlyctochytrium bullatum]